MKFTKTILSILFVIGLLGTTCVLAAAPNTDNKYWHYKSSAMSNTTLFYDKNTSGNVYCYPMAGDPSVYVTVYGSNDIAGSGKVKCSNKVLLYRGNQYTIINSVKAKGHDFSRAGLRFNTMTSTTNTNSGNWSPDATKDYNIKG